MPMNDTPERLFFDAQTGLLLRKITVTTTAAENLPAQVDYDDYRDTGSGVKILHDSHGADHVEIRWRRRRRFHSKSAGQRGRGRQQVTKPESKVPAAAPAGAR